MTTETASEIKPAGQKILLVKAHRVLREGLRKFINVKSDLAVCGEAEYTSQALAKVLERIA